MPFSHSGSISIDGKELRDVDPNSLYDLISLIGQSVFLFDDTIRRNITMFRDFPVEQVDMAVCRSGSVTAKAVWLSRAAVASSSSSTGVPRSRHLAMDTRCLREHPPALHKKRKYGKLCRTGRPGRRMKNFGWRKKEPLRGRTGAAAK